ncbi:unnamed protein product [Linum tenue]|uniref:Glutaredoxin domain-containing protein n=1 Tax=Linum tenue TaxID=586396 RepID=A0AAV0I545_9ROSI|nr:unnamed protein product [Linum tenue]
MGCVSSKHVKKELLREKTILHNGNAAAAHIVSLTSSTYGALQLDQPKHHPPPVLLEKQIAPPEPESVPESEQGSESQCPPEEINAVELMEGLEEGVPPQSKKNSPKSRPPFLRGFTEFDPRSPLKFMNQIGSPRKAKTFGGKENKFNKRSSSSSDFNFSPRPILKPNSNNNTKNCKAAVRLSYPVKSSPKLTDSTESSSNSNSKRSFNSNLSPLFDPELVKLYEREMAEGEGEGEQTPSKTLKLLKKNSQVEDTEALLCSFEEKCPPGGENSVVVYTTTLRGIRRTYEDCNAVRSIVDSYHVHVIERDVSMDSGLKEELRGLMGTKEVRVPLVFVKGRLVGGAEQVAKLDEEGKLEALFGGIPRRMSSGCRRCGGVRFVMCKECNGSSKVLDCALNKKVRCGRCNENGLVQCPICC